MRHKMTRREPRWTPFDWWGLVIGAALLLAATVLGGGA